MKQETLFEILEATDEELVMEAREPLPKKRKHLWVIGLSLAACLILAVGLALLFSGDKAAVLSHGVTVRYTDQTDFPQSKNELIYLTEDEIFTHFHIAAFKGTVSNIQNIELDFSGDKSYRAIAEIQVEDVYSGDCAPGETVKVLLPCPIPSDVWVEDTGVISHLKVGMTGIFMPVVYDENSIWMQNDATLYLKELVEYGLADGIRYAFLETYNGLLFARDAFPSISNASTLEEIEAYVMDMLG